MTPLHAPDQYWKLDEDEKKKLLNQSGPDGPLNYLVPNHLIGLNVSASCNIHDFMYSKARTSKDFKLADKIFLMNLMTQIEERPGVITPWRKILAYVYYSAVRIYSWFHK